MNDVQENPPRSACPHPLRMFNASGDVVAVACDRWQCEVCRQSLSYRWATRVRYGISLRGGTCYHWTVTLPGKVKSSRFAYMVLKSAWDNFRKGLQRHFGTWDYCAFVELHPKRAGIAHFHIISFVACHIRIKDYAHHAGFGHQAKEELLEGWRAAFYVSKYTSKQGANMPKNFRRVRLSQKWPSLPDALYEVPLYPMRLRETFSDYLTRVSVISGQEEIHLLARWEHQELDL